LRDGELIRIFHGVTLEEAQEAVDSFVERKLPLVWECEGIKRVLDPDMSRSDQVLALLYRGRSWKSEGDLRAWVEYSNGTVFRDKVLMQLQKRRLVENDSARQRVECKT